MTKKWLSQDADHRALLFMRAAEAIQVKGFTSASQADLKTQYNKALDAYSVGQVDIFASRVIALEREAYLVSDPIAPQ